MRQVQTSLEGEIARITLKKREGAVPAEQDFTSGLHDDYGKLSSPFVDRIPGVDREIDRKRLGRFPRIEYGIKRSQRPDKSVLEFIGLERHFVAVCLADSRQTAITR